MKDSKGDGQSGSVPEQGNDEPTRVGKRRALVKGAALGIGGLTLSHWTRPVVETVILPAHAQTTPSGSPVITAAGSGSTTLDP